MAPRAQLAMRHAQLPGPTELRNPPSHACAKQAAQVSKHLSDGPLASAFHEAWVGLAWAAGAGVGGVLGRLWRLVGWCRRWGAGGEARRAAARVCRHARERVGWIVVAAERLSSVAAGLAAG